MSISELAQHMAGSAEMFASIAKFGEGEIRKPDVVECKTAKELLQVVQDSTERTKGLFTSITDEELELHYDSPIPNFRGPRKKLLSLVAVHETHHKGQLFV